MREAGATAVCEGGVVSNGSAVLLRPGPRRTDLPVPAPHAPRRTPPPPPDLASRRVRRNRGLVLLLLLALIAGGLWLGLGRGHGTTASPPHHLHVVRQRPVPPKPNPRLDPDWEGDGKPVSMAFGGDVNFPSGSTLGDRLADDPATALGTGVPSLLAGVNLSMVNLETAITTGGCPDPQPKSFDFFAPPTAITALQSAGVTLTTEANNHGEDCGPAGLQMALSARTQSNYTILGIGQNATQAFTPYQTTINGEHVGIIAATQVIDDDLQSGWTATASQPGLASAYDVTDLVDSVEAARKIDDTVVVFLHWGVELDMCPDPLQEPLANVLVQAGADIVIGSHAHVLLGGGYLGSAYVDYGLGNFAFYNTPAPTNQSGSLVITATGRHIDSATWRPAVIEGELPVPLAGAAAAQATASWTNERGCTDLSATPGAPEATTATETSPAPAASAAQLSQDD
jgi:Bacterial capsule synthesis protein PGA_cap